jgi:hypothetical protein
MKFSIFTLPVLGVVLSGCMTQMINQSTCAINQNRYAVEQSTQIIRHNQSLIEESTRAIKANREALEATHSEGASGGTSGGS